MTSTKDNNYLQKAYLKMQSIDLFCTSSMQSYNLNTTTIL